MVGNIVSSSAPCIAALAISPAAILVYAIADSLPLFLAARIVHGATGGVLGASLFALLGDALDATTRLACFVLFVLIGSRIFSLTFYGINGHVWVEELFFGLPGGVWGFLLAVNLLVFVLGCFIDFFEIAFIVVPLIAPVAAKLGIDLVRTAVGDKYVMEEIVPVIPTIFGTNIDVLGANIVNYSYDQFAGMGALDHYAVAGAAPSAA